MVAYYVTDGCNLQSLGGREPAQAAGPVACEQRPDARRIVRASGHDAAGGNEASPAARSGQSGDHRLARAREAALPQSGADS